MQLFQIFNQSQP